MRHWGDLQAGASATTTQSSHETGCPKRALRQAADPSASLGQQGPNTEVSGPLPWGQGRRHPARAFSSLHGATPWGFVLSRTPARPRRSRRRVTAAGSGRGRGQIIACRHRPPARTEMLHNVPYRRCGAGVLRHATDELVQPLRRRPRRSPTSDAVTWLISRRACRTDRHTARPHR